MQHNKRECTIAAAVFRSGGLGHLSRVIWVGSHGKGQVVRVRWVGSGGLGQVGRMMSIGSGE